MPVDPQKNRTPTKSILIIEDNDMLLKLLAKTFEVFGMNVIEAENGLDGWKLFNSQDIDVVLTDIRMPGLDGIELSRRIRNASPDTTIAIMTGVDNDVAHNLLTDGIADHLFVKPFSLSSVCKILTDEVPTA